MEPILPDVYEDYQIQYLDAQNCWRLHTDGFSDFELAKHEVEIIQAREGEMLKTNDEYVLSTLRIVHTFLYEFVIASFPKNTTTPVMPKQG